MGPGPFQEKPNWTFSGKAVMVVSGSTSVEALLHVLPFFSFTGEEGRVSWKAVGLVPILTQLPGAPIGSKTTVGPSLSLIDKVFLLF